MMTDTRYVLRFRSNGLAALLVMTIITILITGSILNFVFVENAYAQNNWYVGKGVQPNTYYTYQIQDHDTNQGQPFLMTIYFKQFNNTGSYWVAPTFVITKVRSLLEHCI